MKAETRIREERERLGLTVPELARAMKVPRRDIRAAEGGDFSIRFLRRLSDFFGFYNPHMMFEPAPPPQYHTNAMVKFAVDLHSDMVLIGEKVERCRSTGLLDGAA